MTVVCPLSEKIKDEVFFMIQTTMEIEGITQAEVARRTGALRYNINKVIRGKSPVSLEFLLKIAESIGLEIELKMRLRKQRTLPESPDENAGPAGRAKGSGNFLRTIGDK